NQLEPADRAGRQEQVAGLEIAVNQTACVRRRQRERSLARDQHGFARVEPAADEPLRKCLEGEPLENEKGRPVVGAAVRQVTDDAWMIESCQHLGFAPESRNVYTFVTTRNLYGDADAAR